MTTIQKARFLLKIKLMHTKIPVWRSFYVPSNISLCRLHIAIQMVMGWRNSHMHEFKFGKLIFLPNNAYADATSENTLPEGNLKLNTFVTKKEDSFIYNYDMGDYWQHKITLEDTNYNAGEENPVLCIDSKGTCPPEDVGSIEGFEHFCKVINNPKNKEYSKIHKWVHDFQGYPNDMKWPDGFEIDKVNEILESEFRLKRKEL